MVLNKTATWGVLDVADEFLRARTVRPVPHASGTLQINTTDYAKTETLTCWAPAKAAATSPAPTQRPILFARTRRSGAREDSGTDLRNCSDSTVASSSRSATRKFELFATASLSLGSGRLQVTYAEARGLLVIVYQPTVGHRRGGWDIPHRGERGLGLPNLPDILKRAAR